MSSYPYHQLYIKPLFIFLLNNNKRLFYQNTQVTEAWNKIAKSFKCSPIEGGCFCTFGTFQLYSEAWNVWPTFLCMWTGMLSHQLKQHVIDGEKTIIQNPTDQQKWVPKVVVGGLVSVGGFAVAITVVFCRKDHEKAEFEVHEVYAVDVLISTGEGKVRVCLRWVGLQLA